MKSPGRKTRSLSDFLCEEQEIAGQGVFPNELLDQLPAQVQNRDAESILDESGLAGHFKKQLAAKRMLAADG